MPHVSREQMTNIAPSSDLRDPLHEQRAGTTLVRLCPISALNQPELVRLRTSARPGQLPDHLQAGQSNELIVHDFEDPVKTRDGKNPLCRRCDTAKHEPVAAIANELPQP
jgi:hypothetical protein